MKISAINYSNDIRQNQSHCIFKRPILKCNNICFRSKNLLEMPKEDVFSRIKESVVPENFIGQGTFAEVYRIKDTDYCIRIPYLAQDNYLKDYSREITPIDKVNHVVAKLGFGVSIRKYFDGVVPKWFMNNSQSRYQLQKQIADMPIKSYSSLLHQIAEGLDNEMLFDIAPGNLIVDTKNKTLTAIDFMGISDNPRPVRPLMEMYSIITSYGSLSEIGKKIFEKVSDAALEEFKPGNIPCMDVALFDFTDLCLKRRDETCFKEDMAIIAEIKKLAEQLKKTKKAEILDKTKSVVLENNIKTMKNMLRQIH